MMLSALCDTLIVAAPAKLALADKGRLLVLLTHTPSAPHAAAAALVAHHGLLGVPSAVSTTSIHSVHNSDPIITHTVTEILHPAPQHASLHTHPHPQHPPHPASSVNSHTLGYGEATHLLAVAPLAGHANIYTLHLGGYGVGLHLGGHGSGHGFYAVI